METELTYEVREYRSDLLPSYWIGDYETEKEAQEVAREYLTEYGWMFGNRYRVEVNSFHKGTPRLLSIKFGVTTVTQ
jgi:hypothetical protein